MRPWARRTKACLLLNDLSLVQIMLPLLNIEPNPCPCLLRADTPELNLTWSCLVGVRLTWAEPHLILLVPSPQFILASSSRRPAELSGLILMDQWPPVGVIFLTPHVPVCFHTPYPHVCHKPHYFTNLYSLPSSSFSVVRTFTLKECLLEPLHWRTVFLPSEGSALGLRVRV